MTGPSLADLIKSAGLRPGEYCQGTSMAACRRYEKRTRGKLHTGQPGQVIKMCRNREYVVWPDGSFRRVKAA